MNLISDYGRDRHGADENGRAAAYYKYFGGPGSGGLVQLWIAGDRFPDFVIIKNVAEHGL